MHESGQLACTSSCCRGWYTGIRSGSWIRRNFDRSSGSTDPPKTSSCLCLFPVWRRPAPLYCQAFCPNRAPLGGGDHLSAVSDRPGGWGNGHPRAPGYVAATSLRARHHRETKARRSPRGRCLGCPSARSGMSRGHCEMPATRLKPDFCRDDTCAAHVPHGKACSALW